jgi:exportin-2 (importin alpha re-exporter)
MEEAANVLYSALQASLSPNPDSRIRGELELKRLQTLAGFAPLALNIVTLAQDDAVRMAGAICFKNFIRNGWGDFQSQSISASDRDAVKNQIVPAIVSSPHRLGYFMVPKSVFIWE